MDMNMQMVIYTLILIISAVLGYYIGKMYAFNMWMSIGGGILVGIAICWIFYKYYASVPGTEGYHHRMMMY